MDLNTLIESYGYLAIVLGSFLDGETSVILGGIAAGERALSLPAVIGLAAFVNLAWDQFYFWLGRRHGPSLMARYPRIQPGFARTSRILERHQALFIVAMRFMVGLRVAGPIAIGVAGVRPLVFTALNAVGALLWAIVFAGFGYLCARGIDVLGVASQPLAFALAGLLAAVGLLWVARCHTRSRRAVRTAIPAT